MLRLAKLMSEKGICSRREAEDFIDRGWVYVDGVKVTEQGFKVQPDVEITLAKEAKAKQNSLVTILLNKPVGYVSSQAEDGYTPAIKLLERQNFFQPSYSGAENPKPLPFAGSPRQLRGLAVAGRLDIDSQGLLIFTQDGRLAKALIGVDSKIEKEYLVRVEGGISEEKMELLRNGGLELDGKKLKKARVEQLNPDQLRMVLQEGKKRQIRRMCEIVGLQVRGLKRVRVGKIPLGPLPEGQWRLLGTDERFF